MRCRASAPDAPPARARAAKLARWVALLATLACHGEGESDEPKDERPSTAAPVEHPAATAESPSAEPEPTRAEVPPYTPASSLGEPVDLRRARSVRTVYRATDKQSGSRGRIPSKERFHVYAHAEPTPDCAAGWAQVADAGWVCLSRTDPDTAAPDPLPRLLEGSDLPFVYARHKAHADDATPPLPVYRSVRSFNAGDDPVEELPAYGSYAFLRYRWNKGTPVMLTATKRAVPAAELHRFDPSAFEGRDLRERPLPEAVLEGRWQLAWSKRWKAAVLATPDPKARVLGHLPQQGELYVNPTSAPGPGGEPYFEVLALEPGTGLTPAKRRSDPAALAGGWVAGDDLRRWLPLPPEGGTGDEGSFLAGERLLDVDLDEQMLTVWHEGEPIYVTLVSSGRAGDRTPPGLYRVKTKYAFGKMASLPSDDDPYFVEAVPWAIYFSGRYAFHAAYWHGRFGQRMSHGCVNLSPRDAKRVFELSTPTLPDGWRIVHEHPVDPGTQVRIRRAGHELPDRRKLLE